MPCVSSMKSLETKIIYSKNITLVTCVLYCNKSHIVSTSLSQVDCLGILFKVV